MLQGFIVQATYALASYLGSKQIPTLREGIAIGLVFLSVLVAGRGSGLQRVGGILGESERGKPANII